ncbi:helix-turn-helix domain-containing protein [Pseudomonas serbica]|jgi:LuxR family quorum-sensing transcriptional regulator LasR
MSTHRPLDYFAGAASDGAANEPPVHLTAKESQALMWCYRGKTSWEIARIQDCSPTTINFHFSNIRRKFAVRSRHAALLKAIESGVICVDSVDSVDERGGHELV